MKVIIFGSTGMVGQGVLQACLRDADVREVLVVVRSPIPQEQRTHPKLRELVHTNFEDFSGLEATFDADACFWCLGVTSAGMSEADYTRVTHDFTLAAAKVLVRPTMTFVLVSGTGADGKAMWARVKRKTEEAVRAIPFKDVYVFRPGMIEPLDGIPPLQRAVSPHLAAHGPDEAREAGNRHRHRPRRSRDAERREAGLHEEAAREPRHQRGGVTRRACREAVHARADPAREHHAAVAVGDRVLRSAAAREADVAEPGLAWRRVRGRTGERARGLPARQGLKWTGNPANPTPIGQEVIEGHYAVARPALADQLDRKFGWRPRRRRFVAAGLRCYERGPNFRVKNGSIAASSASTSACSGTETRQIWTLSRFCASLTA